MLRRYESGVACERIGQVRAFCLKTIEFEEKGLKAAFKGGEIGVRHGRDGENKLGQCQRDRVNHQPFEVIAATLSGSTRPMVPNAARMVSAT